MKYVVFQNESFAIIPESAGHGMFKSMNPVSAGFCRLESYRDQYDDLRFKVQCWGESTTLKLKSRGSIDESILQGGLH